MQLYDSKGDVIESTMSTAEVQQMEIEEIPSVNFRPPTPKPEWFDKKLLELGGYFDPGANTIPKYRVVWGMDPEVKHFAMGRMRMKYPMFIDNVETITGVWLHRQGRKKKWFGQQEAMNRFWNPETKQFDRGGKPGELIVPEVVKEEREIGTPLWIVEQFVPPEAFGTYREWEKERFLVNPENKLDYIDALGEYPKHGAYLHWIDLYDVDKDGRQCYRPLDDGAYEIVRANHVMNVARRKAMSFAPTREQRQIKRDEQWNQMWEKQKQEMVREILDVKKNRATNIVPR